MRLYQRLLTLTDEAITSLRTIQETQTESQRNAMASRAANDSIRAFYDSQRGAGDELPRLRHDLVKAGEVIQAYREQDERIAVLLGVSLDADLVKAVEDLCKKAATPPDSVTAYVDGRRVQAVGDARMLREKASEFRASKDNAAKFVSNVIGWCAYLIDTADEVPLQLRSWIDARAKS